MAAQPTIYDMLAWQQGGEAGQAGMAEHLFGLLGQAGLVPEDIGYSADVGRWEQETPHSTSYEWNPAAGGITGETEAGNILGALFGGDTSFQDMSEEDLREAFMSVMGGIGQSGLEQEELADPHFTGGGYTPLAPEEKYSGFEWAGSDIDEMVNSLLGLQEGMGLQESILGQFGLEGRLGGIERKSERAQRSALESYIPRETVSRYRGLQGIGGTEAGEASEAKYLADISAAERREGRGVRSIYGELEDRLFGGQQRWLQNMLG